jgi:hypothetical protein
MRGYFVPLAKINEPQCESIERTVERCKHAHHTDLQIRINGAYEYAEADWIKHMLVLPDVDDMTTARMEIAELRDKLAHASMVIDHYRKQGPTDPNAGKGAEQAHP